jgi:hypothetical protein
MKGRIIFWIGIILFQGKKWRINRHFFYLISISYLVTI